MKYNVVCFPLLSLTVYGFSEYDAVSQYKQMLNIPKSTELCAIVTKI